MKPPVGILIVDDHRESLQALARVLEGPEYEVVTAESGPDALKKILRREFAVVLLDVVMPGLDGFDTARLIRQREASRELPIVFLTATGSDVELVAQGYSVGAVDYLSKPVNPAIVKAKVAVFADLSRKALRIREQEERLRRAEREVSERALRESEALYQTTFDQAPIGIAHTATDGRWLRVNKRFLEIVGYPEDELYALRTQDIVHPDDLASTVSIMKRMLDGEIEREQLDKRYLHKSGVPVWVRITLSLMRDARGRPKQFIKVVEDVSERRLDDLRQRFLAAASAALLSSLDVESTLSEVAQLAVGSFADACAVHLSGEHGVRELIIANRRCDAAAVRALLGQLDSPHRGLGRVIASGEQQLLRDPRDERFSSLLMVPIMAQGRALGALSFASRRPTRGLATADAHTASDLAQRAAFAIEHARLYRAAQDAVSARDEFLSIASHELRTPLTPLYIVFQRLLADGSEEPLAPLDSERTRGMLLRSQRQVQRLTALVDNLLDVSRISAGRLKLIVEAGDLGEIVHDVAARMTEELTRAECALTVEVDGDVHGSWDRLRVEQVVTNLLSNALKYGAGKPIAVTVRSAGASAFVSVRDQGIGIEPEQIPRIFERFERAVSSRSYGGLGLGLYIARQIAEAHGGSIRAESEPGAGATFTLELPLAPAAGATDDLGHSGVAPDSDSNGDRRACSVR